MKLNARLTTVSFLAVAAMGAAAFAFGGCTVTSGTVDDTDSGTTTPTDSGTTDSGKTDSGAATCDGNKQSGDLVGPACQACLNGGCCTELKGCFNLSVDTDGGTLDCNLYATCVSDCLTKPSGDQAACFADCDTAAGAGVAAAYDTLDTCASTKCATPCGYDTPSDAGTD